MIRSRRTLDAGAACAAVFVLLAGLGCGADGGSGNDVPGYAGPVPEVETPLPTPPTDEPEVDETPGPVSETPAGEELPAGVPLDPPGNEDDGETGAPTPPDEPTPPEEPPPPATTFVEDTGVDCAVPALPNGNLPNNTSLPDPFLGLNGERITQKAQWSCRRQEIKRTAERFIYGEKPPRPESVSGSVSADSITVNVSHQGRSTSFTVSVDMPTNGANGPVPALVSVGNGFFGFSHNNLVRDTGVAVINYDPYAVGSEATARNNKTGAFYDIYGAQSQTGLLVAWAWGVSRIIDVIEQAGGEVLLADAMAVAGCSRFGKGAFTIGAFDERIALTIPFESGSGGVPIWRGIPGEGAQSPGSAFGETYWLGDAFGAFTNNVNSLPVDTHEIVAMVAPRGLLILDNPYIANLGPESAHVAALAGAEVFNALGVGANISYHSAVASGTHCEARPEHQQPLRQNLQKFLLKTGDAAGSIVASGSATGNLGPFKNWETPTLE